MMLRKKLAVILSATLLFGLAYIPSASADGMTSEENNIAMNVAYAEQILYCDSPLRFKRYQNGQIFDNNGGCVDPTPLFADGGDGWAQLAQIYQGGMYRWQITADNGKSCFFNIYHGDPDADAQVLVWDAFFTACSVRLNRPVTENWVAVDYEFPDSSPVITKCADSIDPFAGYENNCLKEAYEVMPSGDVRAGTVTYINKAANRLKRQFYASFVAHLSYDRKANKLTAVVMFSPLGVKVYIQKWTDYHWVTVKSGERFLRTSSYIHYTKASSGKYRILMKSVVGSKFITKPLVV
jgi:hypothetical protein